MAYTREAVPSIRLFYVLTLYSTFKPVSLWSCSSETSSSVHINALEKHLEYYFYKNVSDGPTFRIVTMEDFWTYTEALIHL